jgi:nicotinamide mononucleotide transporter
MSFSDWSIWDWVVVITGVLGVILTIFETIWCWPVALISVIISTITFYQQRLYGDMSLNVFYFFSGIYGWFYWNKKKGEAFIVAQMPRHWYLPIVLSIVIQTIIYYYLLHYFKSDQVLFDSILTACSFSCTFMMTKKWIENWLFWILIDGAYCVLYIIKDMPAYALLYGFFSITVIYGYFKWKRQLTTR